MFSLCLPSASVKLLLPSPVSLTALSFRVQCLDEVMMRLLKKGVGQEQGTEDVIFIQAGARCTQQG